MTTASKLISSVPRAEHSNEYHDAAAERWSDFAFCASLNMQCKGCVSQHIVYLQSTAQQQEQLLAMEAQHCHDVLKIQQLEAQLTFAGAESENGAEVQIDTCRI